MFPGLAAMARDFLSIPLATTGVERVFNLARDICHYRRGRLSPETISKLVFCLFQQHSDSAIDRARQQLRLILPSLTDISSQDLLVQI